jgi:hypothetical protein
MFYVLYPFVTYLLTLPRTSMIYGKSYHRNYAYVSQPQHRTKSSSLPSLFRDGFDTPTPNVQPGGPGTTVRLAPTL